MKVFSDLKAATSKTMRAVVFVGVQSVDDVEKILLKDPTLKGWGIHKVAKGQTGISFWIKRGPTYDNFTRMLSTSGLRDLITGFDFDPTR